MSAIDLLDDLEVPTERSIHSLDIPKDSVTLHAVREAGNLLTVDDILPSLEATDSLSEVTLPKGGVKWRFEEDWASPAFDPEKNISGFDLVPVFVETDNQEYQLTWDTAIAAATSVGLSAPYAKKSPSKLTTVSMNYWFGGSSSFDNSYKILVNPDNQAVAYTREALVPYSNSRLLEMALLGIREKLGSDTSVFVDPKFVHNLNETYIRLVVPEYSRLMTDTREDDDVWSVGLQLRNSVVGKVQTTVQGYLFRYLCSNGAIDTRHSLGAWNRQTSSGDVYQWVMDSADSVLAHIGEALDGVQNLTSIPVDGRASSILNDYYNRFSVNKKIRSTITENMADAPTQSMYSVMNAFTQAAKDLSLTPKNSESLMTIGGTIAVTEAPRCGSCHRIK